MGTSEEKTGWFGDKYTEHTGPDGEPAGTSEEKTGWFGDKYTEHTGPDGEPAGTSAEKTGWFGDKYTEHTCPDGEQAGTSEEKTGWFGDKYTEHTGPDGEPTGTSEEKVGWFGDKYTEHTGSGSRGTHPKSTGGSATSSSGGSSGNSSIGAGVGGVSGVVGVFVALVGGGAFAVLVFALMLVPRSGGPDGNGKSKGDEITNTIGMKQIAAVKERRRQEEERAKREAELARAARERTNQVLVPLDKAVVPAGEPPNWADVCDFDVRQGAALVHFLGIQQKGENIELRITVRNKSRKALEFHRWSAASDDDPPVLIAEDGKHFPAQPDPGSAVTIPPASSSGDALVFKGKLPPSDLKLELPGACIGGEGKLRILIPKLLVVLELAPSLGDKTEFSLRGYCDGLPLLRELVKDKRRRLRLGAVAALGTLGETGTSLVLVSELAGALEDESPEVRAKAANSLGKIGTMANSSMPAILRALKDREPKVRAAAVLAIPKIRLEDEAMAPLLAALKDEDETVALAAGKVLKDSGKMERKHVPAIAEAVKDGSADGRAFALSLLVDLAPQWADARTIAAIAGALDDKEMNVRLQAVRALGDLGPKAWRAVPELAGMLANADDQLKTAAIASLGKIGPRAASATPGLITLWKMTEWHDDAAVALVKIGKGSVSALIDALDNVNDYKLRVKMITLIGEIGRDAEEAVKRLETLLEQERLEGVRNALKKSLAKIRKKGAQRGQRDFCR